MSFRTALKNLIRRDPTANLRERAAEMSSSLTATKQRAALAVKVGRIALQPPAPEPEPVDRIALINYATWLAHERRLLCHELYPEAGPGADRFVLANVASAAFHFPYDGRSWRDVPQPSTRAVRILDSLGIDWRADEKERDDLDPPPATPAAMPTPHGYPQTDGTLLAALSDMQRIDAMLAGVRSADDRDEDELPEWRALNEARDAAIGTLIHTRAKSLPGLQAKAKAILADGFRGDDGTALEIAHGLARDLIDRQHKVLQPSADPIHAALDALRRLEAVCAKEWAKDNGDEAPPARDAALNAVPAYWRGVVLKTVPTTAAGAAALARFARAYHQRWAASLDQDGPTVLDLIARSPLL